MAKAEAAEKELAAAQRKIEDLKAQKLKEDARALEVMKRLKQKSSEAQQEAAEAARKVSSRLTRPSLFFKSRPKDLSPLP